MVEVQYDSLWLEVSPSKMPYGTMDIKANNLSTASYPISKILELIHEPDLKKLKFKVYVFGFEQGKYFGEGTPVESKTQYFDVAR